MIFFVVSNTDEIFFTTIDTTGGKIFLSMKKYEIF